MSTYDPPPRKPDPHGAPAGAITSVEYMRPFNWVFENPNWFVNALLVMVCMFIPVVGPLVVLGYQFTVIEYMHRRLGATYPDFDFGRFGDFLVRGLWPFLVSFLANLVLTPLMVMLYLAVFFCFSIVSSAALSQGGEAGALGALCGLASIVLMFAVILLISVLLGMVLVPMMLRAGLAQDFAAGFDFGFVMDFIGKMWKEMVLAFLVYTVAVWLAMAVGSLVVCIGAYFAMACMMLAYSNLLWQLYEVYLSRGGKPIPLKEPAPTY